MTADFKAGVEWVCRHLDTAALQVELDQRGDVANSEGKLAVNAIIKTGNVQMARKLRELAVILREEAAAL